MRARRKGTVRVEAPCWTSESFMRFSFLYSPSCSVSRSGIASASRTFSRERLAATMDETTPMPQAPLTIAAQRKPGEVVRFRNQRKPFTARKLMTLPTRPARRFASRAARPSR